MPVRCGRQRQPVVPAGEQLGGKTQVDEVLGDAQGLYPSLVPHPHHIFSILCYILDNLDLHSHFEYYHYSCCFVWSVANDACCSYSKQSRAMAV